MVHSPSERPWWRDAVVYQIYVRSFADANGDGKGDLQGIIEHLDHLAALRLDAIWLCPCFPSPQIDHGYDVADYFDIEPSYGDLATFDRLVAAARERGIRVMLDVVPNHCSTDHEWFIAALGALPGSTERARFYFRDGRGERGELPPNNWRAVFGGSAWTRVVETDGAPGQWYLHMFTPGQPDFNWDDDSVQGHFDRVLQFWFDRGVDGFRVDAVAVVGKAAGLPDQHLLDGNVTCTEQASANEYVQFQPKAHEYWRRWRRVVDRYEHEHPGRRLVTVSEAYTPGRPDLLLGFVQPDQFHQSFNFDLMMAPWIAEPIRHAVADVYDVLTAAGASATWTLNNHDTQRSVTRFGRANATSLESWTKNNLVYVDAPVDEVLGRRRSDAMVAFVAALPGSLYLYQGEELGLPEVLDIPGGRRQDPLFVRSGGAELGRDGCRVPLPWTDHADTSYGFSSVVPAAEPWLPVPDRWGQWAVDRQEQDPSSTLAHYRHLLGQRRLLDREAPLEWVLADHDDLVCFWRGAVLVVLNVGAHPIVLPADLVAGATLIVSSVRDHGDPATVAGDACMWLLFR
ncbi:MAG: alpha-amylase family glycosyl hydrolase [Actinomycetota bacterium]